MGIVVHICMHCILGTAFLRRIATTTIAVTLLCSAYFLYNQIPLQSKAFDVTSKKAGQAFLHVSMGHGAWGSGVLLSRLKGGSRHLSFTGLSGNGTTAWLGGWGGFISCFPFEVSVSQSVLRTIQYVAETWRMPQASFTSDQKK
jgi:hypothetical protein